MPTPDRYVALLNFVIYSWICEWVLQPHACYRSSILLYLPFYWIVCVNHSINYSWYLLKVLYFTIPICIRIWEEFYENLQLIVVKCLLTVVHFAERKCGSARTTGVSAFSVRWLFEWRRRKMSRAVQWSPWRWLESTSGYQHCGSFMCITLRTTRWSMSTPLVAVRDTSSWWASRIYGTIILSNFVVAGYAPRKLTDCGYV